ncbi:hypothetical protein BDQ17DRAFT_1334569 [Cyathus striatus]|nr:hypothetical protein BDQ17DRAFT_1334569 [Cyathus striatus]
MAKKATSVESVKPLLRDSPLLTTFITGLFIRPPIPVDSWEQGPVTAWRSDGAKMVRCFVAVLVLGFSSLQAAYEKYEFNNRRPSARLVLTTLDKLELILEFGIYEYTRSNTHKNAIRDDGIYDECCTSKCQNPQRLPWPTALHLPAKWIAPVRAGSRRAS